MSSNPLEPNDDRDKDPFQEMLARMFGTSGAVNPEELAKAAGLPSDPNALQAMMGQVQAMFQAMTTPSAAGDSPVNWSMAKEQARKIAASTQDPSLSDKQKNDAAQALRVAELWIDPVTAFSETGLVGQAWSRAEWVEKTMAVWQKMTTPVANSMAAAMSEALTQQMPEEMRSMLGQAAPMLQNMGGAMFGMQLGQAIGTLSQDVVSSTDIGVPLVPGAMALLPTNIAAFGEGLDIEAEEVRLFLAVREAAHVRLFTRVPWLGPHLISSIEKFASGVHIDMSRIEDVARGIDPSNPESVQEALSGGVLTPELTPPQKQALTRLETTLALIEGWVDEITAAATTNLPNAAALRETVRRRRATGGPGEKAFGQLVGLELRPRRLREAATLWAHLKDERGIEGRDAVWEHPDIMPSDEDLDDPQGFTSRRSLLEASSSEMDEALQALLDGDMGGSDGSAGSAGADDAAGSAGSDGNGANGGGAGEADPDGDSPKDQA